MTEYCKQCGAEIPDAATFCPQCGNQRTLNPEAPETAPVSPDVPDPVPAEPKKKKVKWWMIVIPIVLALVLAVALLWETLYVHFVPQVALVEAWSNTIVDIQQRYEGNPFSMMAKAYDETRKNSIDMSVDLSIPEQVQLLITGTGQVDALTTQAQYDIHLNAKPATSDVAVDVDLAMYLDKNFLALRVNQLTGEEYIGIAFKTFSEDIRGNSMISEALGEDTLVILEQFVDILEEALNVTTPDFELSEEYAALLTKYASSLEFTVKNTKVTLEGEKENAFAITFQVPVSDIGDLFAQYVDLMEADQDMKALFTSAYSLDVPNSPSAEDMWTDFLESSREASAELKDSEGMLTVTSKIADRRVLRLDITVGDKDEEGDPTEVTAILTFGKNPSQNDITLTASNEDDQQIDMVFSTARDPGALAQKLSYTVRGTEDDGSFSLGYSWKEDTGDMAVSFNFESEQNEPVDFTFDIKLKEEEDGYTLELDILEMISSIEAATGTELFDFEGAKYVMSYTIRKGTEITVPQYTNIKELTQDKLFELLMNLYDNYG